MSRDEQIKANLESGLNKLRTALYNHKVTGLLLTDTEVAAILLHFEVCDEIRKSGLSAIHDYLDWLNRIIEETPDDSYIHCRVNAEIIRDAYAKEGE